MIFITIIGDSYVQLNGEFFYRRFVIQIMELS
jgi:hypothetical protein